LGLHHEGTSTLPLDLLLTKYDLAVPPFHIISFVVNQRHGRFDGGLVLPVRPAPRRPILEGVVAGPAASPLAHGMANFCLALWHYRCAGSRGFITGRIRLACTLPNLRFDGRRLDTAQRAQGLGCWAAFPAREEGVIQPS